jgi:hypothetical protein
LKNFTDEKREERIKEEWSDWEKRPAFAAGYVVAGIKGSEPDWH